MSAPPPYPETQVIRTGWRAWVDPRPAITRVRESAIPIAQIVVAATGAYAFAHLVLGHAAPLLAAIVTISSLGLVRDARPGSILRSALGMLLGIAIAELFVLLVGHGWWQLSIALAAALFAGRLLSREPSFAIAAAIQATIVMVLPVSAPFAKLLDGVVGGVAALLVTVLIPRNPLATSVRDGRRLFDAFQGAAAAVVQSLHRGDRLRAQRGLDKARALQPAVDVWRASLESGQAIARISPFLARQRAELRRQEGMLGSVDLAIRNLRVIARRGLYLCDDGVPRPVLADLLAEVMRAAHLVGESLDDVEAEAAAREALRAVAGRLGPEALPPDATLGDLTFVAGLRPLAVDLLVAAGESPEAARAAVPRV